MFSSITFSAIYNIIIFIFAIILYIVALNILWKYNSEEITENINCGIQKIKKYIKKGL